MARTGIVKDRRFINHRPGQFHPESPKRLETIYAMLEEPEMAGLFEEIPVRRAEKEELCWVHSPDYVAKVAETDGKDHVALDPDTSTSAGSYEAALLAVGGLCEAISQVITGELDNAFALVRPPGHHAEQDRAMGFCLFNNVAVGARYAQQKHGLERILVIDWDLHHGNGTQHSFEEDPSILYFSTHQSPYYPGTGSFQELGTGKGQGFTVNVPLSIGHGDGEYIGIFEKILNPIATQFNPDLILVSAGFDIYEGDPLGGMRVTPEGFAGLMRSVMDFADGCCDGKIVVTLEGGYELGGLRDSVKAVLKELAGISKAPVQEILARADMSRVESSVRGVFEHHARFWKDLVI